MIARYGRARYTRDENRTHALRSNGRTLCGPYLFRVNPLTSAFPPGARELPRINVGPVEITGGDCTGEELNVDPSEVPRFVSCLRCQASIRKTVRETARQEKRRERRS